MCRPFLLLLLGGLAGCAPKASVDADGDADSDGDGDGDGDGGPRCVNLQCRIQDCVGGGTTRLTGVVYAPTLENPDPVPGVSVYVPNAELAPFSPTVECVTCTNQLSGAPIVETVTATDGSFVLEGVPAGDDVPVVMQLGRWRRRITVDVPACADTVVPPEQSRLPRNRSEGDIPRMALATGAHDALECTLAKIVDVAEITAPGGEERIHLYRQSGYDMATPLPLRAELVGSRDTLMGYDAVLLPCPSHDAYSAEEGENLHAYADAGGRVFNTHGGGFWMLEPTDLYGGIVAWNNQPDPSVRVAEIDTSFDKGVVFADWLSLVGATAEYGRITLGAPQWFVDSVQAPAQRWVHTLEPATVQHFTFNTPLGAADGEHCGRVLFSNFHVSSSQESGLFPDSCTGGPLTADEKVIEFMLFDVTGCLTPDVF